MTIATRHGYTTMSLDDFEEYLADKPADEKWELIGGRVVKSMVGARWTHHRIVRNIDFSLQTRLRGAGSPCHTFTETFWLKQRFIDLAVFPDVMVQCGEPDRQTVAIDDPVVLIEVVSPGSEARDRIEKARLYARLPSLMHLLLVERDAPIVDLDNREGENTWRTPARIEGLGAVVPLPALGIELPLSEIYRDVLG